MDLVSEVYRCTQKFPREETYGLTSQLRRAAVSVPSNIAEGQGRRYRKEFVHFLRNARGSVMEIETQILISKRLGYLDQATSAKLLSGCDEISRLLQGLITSQERE
jgi:four helix bundle protein